ncbi:hypothetical protein C8J57DRAFT_1439323 [Mycena rebaudengoi]|nr:hypothetical protein C8J57DRAFT_1439323 [Mycena rebaudengoi]
METHCGIRRSSYIWGWSVHNIGIECLWVDITVQLGATWSEHFTILELRYGLDINNISHIWLLHFLFLSMINSQLAFFAESWNQHRIQIRHGPNRSPADMSVFDMLTHGVHGNQLLAEEENMNKEELEVYGATSWIGRVGLPPLTELTSVVVEAPAGMLNDDQVLDLYNAVLHLLGSADNDDCIALWTHALVHAHHILPDLF